MRKYYHLTYILKCFFLLFFLSFFSQLFANENEEGSCVIKGKVTTADKKPAALVNVVLKGTKRNALTDDNGNFILRNIVPGNYELEISLLGYETITQNVIIEANKTASVSLELKVSDKQLQEVVVTTFRNAYKANLPSSSLRVQTPLIELPQNIQVITKGLLNDQQAFDMLDAVQRNVSGAQKVEHWDNYARINMRGSQITAFRNGMNVQMPWGPLTEDMSMVERIEFVKGPAGFMLANGEPSGFYNVVTKKPSGQTKGEASFSLGSFDLYRSTLDLDGKLSKDGKLLYRLNVMGELKGSYRDYEYNNRYSVVPVIKYLIDENTAVTLEYTHQFSQMSVIGSNYAFSKRKYAELPVNFTTAEPNLDPTNINDNSVLAIFEHKLDDDWKFTAQAAYFHYSQVGQSLWPYSISGSNDSLMQRGISIWDALGINKTGQMFLNGTFSTGRISHKILTGIDMGHKDYYADWNQGSTLGDSTFNIYKPVYGTVAASALPVWDRSKDIRERGVRYNNSYNSFYVQDEIGLIDNKLRITLAGRYTTNKDIDPYSGSTNDSKFTPRAAISYSLDKNASVYFVYDQAFVANPGTDWQGKNFDPITGNNIEFGIKKDWLNGKWNSALSVYKIIKNNQLTTDTEHPNETTGQFTYSRQTGQQQVKGIEFDIKGQITNNIEAVINYACTDAVVTKDSDPSLVGNQVAGATKHIQNTWLTYKIINGKLRGLKLSAGYQYQAGRSSWFIFNKTENALPDYFRLDAGVSYQLQKFSINLNVNNLLNKYLYSGAPYYGLYYWQTEALRNARVTVSYMF